MTKNVRIRRKSDGLWLASVSQHLASWQREETRAMTLPRADLPTYSKWLVECEVIDVPDFVPDLSFMYGFGFP